MIPETGSAWKNGEGGGQGGNHPPKAGFGVEEIC